MSKRRITVIMLAFLSCQPTFAVQQPKPSVATEIDALVLKAVLHSQCRSKDGYVLLSPTAIAPRSDDGLANVDESGAFEDLKSRSTPPGPLPKNVACKGVRLHEDREIRQFFEQHTQPAGKASLDEKWQRLYASFPGATGWMSLSLPGYSRSGDIAIVYVALHCGSLCGQGSYVYVHRIDGQWEVLARFPIWVS